MSTLQATRSTLPSTHLEPAVLCGGGGSSSRELGLKFGRLLAAAAAAGLCRRQLCLHLVQLAAQAAQGALTLLGCGEEVFGEGRSAVGGVCTESSCKVRRLIQLFAGRWRRRAAAVAARPLGGLAA